MPGEPSIAAIPSPAGLRPSGHCVLLKHGEIVLKGRNRHRFTERLHDNLRRALRGVGGSTWIKSGQHVTVLGGDIPQDVLVDRARRVIGFNSVEPAVRVPTSVTDITEAAVAALAGVRAERPGVTFAVRVKRRDKNFEMTSSQFERFLGARVREALGPVPVNLSHPDVRISIEIDHKESYVSWVRHQGPGGLPVGSSGRALVLLSGGYDSPVAAYRAMRRGLRCDFVHFTGAPYTNAASMYKAYALARELNRYQPAGRLHVIALGQAQKQLAIAGAGRLQVVAQRRLMVRVASALAGRIAAEALVTGDSLGQVASQTLANLAAVDEAATLPVLRPLIGWEKQEIIDEARSIGTEQISVLPDEDCCKLLAPPRVTLRAGLADLRSVEKRLDLDDLMDGLLRDVQIMHPGETDEETATEAGSPDEDPAPDRPGPAVCGAPAGAAQAP